MTDIPKTQLGLSLFITHSQDYHTHVYSKNINISTHTFSNFSKQKSNPSPGTGPQDLLITHYNCEQNEQKTLHKYAINQEESTLFTSFQWK